MPQKVGFKTPKNWLVKHHFYWHGIFAFKMPISVFKMPTEAIKVQFLAFKMQKK